MPATPSCCVPLDSGRVLAAADAVDGLRALGLDSLEGALAYTGTVARAAGKRCTYRIPVGGSAWYLKIYRGLSLGERLRGRRSPARREWDNIETLDRAGFEVPARVAVGEGGAAVGAPVRSFLLTRAVDGDPLHQFLRRRDAAQGQALHALAGLVRRFHDSGFFHRDLYCGHVLRGLDGRLWLIDLARVGRGAPPRRRWLVKDLAALESSAPSAVSRSARLRFLLRYLGKARGDAEARRWVRAILAKSRRIRRHVPRYG